MRPGLVFASICLLLLSVMQMADQSYGAAIALLVLSLVVLTVARGPTKGVQSQHQRGSTAVSPETLEAHRRSARGWRYIGIGGLALSIASVWIFPPLSLVLAGLSLYSIHRMRREDEAVNDARGPDATREVAAGPR